MLENKKHIKSQILTFGREIISSKGSAFLTARKLSEASGFSIGTIYNNFSSMDELIAEQNRQTLQELLNTLKQVLKTRNRYQNINNYLDVFIEFVLKNKELWFLFFDFHFTNNTYIPSFSYKKLLCTISAFAKDDIAAIFPQMDKKRLKVSFSMLIWTIFAQSSMLTTNILDNSKSINKQNFCKLSLNTYLAGMMLLDKD